MKTKINILFISANPLDTPQIQVVRESKVILESIKLSIYRDCITIHPHHLATVHDLRRALLENEFDIVHVSGHGTNSGIVLEKDNGTAYVVPQEALADLFQAYSPPLQCVILNSCYAISQGLLISTGVPFTIAMEGRVDDLAAIEFSRGFYDAIGAGRDIEFAYDEGCRTIKLTLSNAQFNSRILRGGNNKVAMANLSSDMTSKRIKAARWLGTTRQKTAFPSLVEHLKTEGDPEVRYWIIVALGQMRNDESKQLLMNLETRIDTDKLAIQDALTLLD